MSARALPLLFFPLMVLVAGILMSATATVPNSSQRTAVEFCANPQQQNCVVQGSIGTSYYCDPGNALGVFQNCKILPACTAPPYPSPAYCITNGLQAIGGGCAIQFALQGSAGCGVYLDGGFSVFIPTTQIVSSISTTGTYFGFVGSGASGFVSMIGVAVGIISLAGLAVFGSGEQGEGLHILFMGGMVLGLWLVLSGLDGYPGGRDVMFTGMDSAISGAGAFIYSILTISVVGGFIGLVSRGS